MKLRSPLAAAALFFLLGAAGPRSAGASTLRGGGGEEEEEGDSLLAAWQQLPDGEVEVNGFAGAGGAASVDYAIVKSLLKRVETNNGGMGDISKLVKPLVKKLLGQVDTAHNVSVTALTEHATAIEECRGTNYSISDPWPQAEEPKKNYLDTKKTISDCENQQAPLQTLADNCGIANNALEMTLKGTCKVVKESPNLQEGICRFATNAETPEMFYKRMSEFWNKKLTEFSNTKTECDNGTATLKTEKKKCGVSKKQAFDKKINCSSAKHGLSMTACNYQQELERVCNTYSACWKEKTGLYKKLVSDTKKAVTARKLNYRMMKRLDCLVGAMDSKTGKVNKAAMDKCVAKGRYKTDHLDIKYPEEPAQKPCDSKPPKELKSVKTDCAINVTSGGTKK